MVKIKNIKDLLAETPFFEDMEDNLELLSGCGTLVRFNEGEFLLKEGEKANSFYLIRKGNVSIESHIPGGTLSVSKVGAQGIVGYSWLFSPYRNQFDSRATSNVEAIKLDGKCLRSKAQEDHELGYQLMKRFAELMLQRMQSTRRQMLDIYGESGQAA
jgi:CRP-like cAMP-binding protein